MRSTAKKSMHTIYAGYYIKSILISGSDLLNILILFFSVAGMCPVQVMRSLIAPKVV